MYRILIFGGTTEGRTLCEKLLDIGIKVTISVTTDYGKEVLPKDDKIKTIVNKLEYTQMLDLIREYDVVIDATHPYADKATVNINRACSEVNVEYLRLLRDESLDSEAIYMDNVDMAVDYLNNTNGNILLTTGSKDLNSFTKVNNYYDRIYPRVLPTVESIKSCNSLGYASGNIIAMQGPFSTDMNTQHIKWAKAKYIVSKESGVVGGLPQKLMAARITNASLILIGRPLRETGYSVDEVMNKVISKAKSTNNKVLNKGYFPLFVSLEKKVIRVFGGGKIASRRVSTLINFGCNIQVIAPRVSKVIEDLSKIHNITITYKEYEKSDIDGCFMVLGLTNNRDVNHSIYLEATRLNIPCNIGDKKEECSFYFPGIAIKDNVVVGVTSSGEDHALAKSITQEIKNLL